MRANVSLRKLYAHFERNCPKSNWKIYIDSFFFQCKVNNLTQNTHQVYAERLFYFARYLSEMGIDVDEVTKRVIQEYVVLLQEKVSDVTVNGRIRVFRCFWNHLCEEELWDKPNPCHKMKLIREESRIKPVVTPEQYVEVLKKIDKGGQPYIFHPLRVAERVAGDREKTVAFLHDVVEDSEEHTLESLAEDGFPEDITDAIDALTKRDSEPYEDYLARVKLNAMATVVKISDLEDNLDTSRLPGPPDKVDIARSDKYKYALKYLNDS